MGAVALTLIAAEGQLGHRDRAAVALADFHARVPQATSIACHQGVVCTRAPAWRPRAAVPGAAPGRRRRLRATVERRGSARGMHRASGGDGRPMQGMTRSANHRRQ
jgi:hypothetical protein